jgi:hypothetical protein
MRARIDFGLLQRRLLANLEGLCAAVIQTVLGHRA